ncbi:MAG TPA: HAD-IIB family hydrolase [Polyangia bacterium]|nr:HAD-IIB family hydrolase [Polyangia bacterium]
MRYHVLACDYDGTLAHDGRLDDETAEALRRLRATGRRVVLVTGRILEDLQRVCPALELFDLVVAENGAVLYTPATRASTPLAGPPSPAFVDALRLRGVRDLGVGQVVVATRQPHAQTVLEVIRELGLELQVIFNKGAVMVLPSGLNKATGLLAALALLRLSPHNAVAVGDAENDHAMLAACECGAAVANALPALREHADLVTTGDHGAGVAELCERLRATDLAELAPRLARHDPPLGREVGTDAEVTLPSFGGALLVAGTSGGGKSTAVTGLAERFAERGYQVVIIDPEGDYTADERGVVLGEARRPPTVEEITQALARPDLDVVVNLFGQTLDSRPAFFAALLPHLLELRARTGRPHWIIVDEAHHLMPRDADGGAPAPDMSGFVLVTVHPEQVARSVIAAIDRIMVMGRTPSQAIAAFAAAGGDAAPPVDDGPLEAGEAYLWRRGDEAPPRRIRPARSQAERKRHTRKYADGELGPDKSFYFRGADGRLNLRAQNLRLFLQMGEGVDAATWFHHLRQRDFSTWAREAIKDEPLAWELAAIEADAASDGDPAASRAAVRQAVERRYTLPADA